MLTASCWSLYHGIIWDSGFIGTISVIPSAPPPTGEVGLLPYLTRFSYAGWTFRRFQTFSANCSTGRIFGRICNSYAANLSMRSLETLEKLKGQRDCNLAAAACPSALQDGAKQRRRREKRGLRAYERRRLRQRPALPCQFSAKENVFMDCNLYSVLNSSACCNIGGENLLC